MLATRYLGFSASKLALWAAAVLSAAACGEDGASPANGVGGDGSGGEGVKTPEGAAGTDAGAPTTSAGASAGAGGEVSVPGGAPGGGADTGPGGGPAAIDFLSLHRSGTRLSVQVLRAAGAPERFERFYDEELGVPCKAGKLSDGRWYCLPESPEGLTFLGYADQACEHPVYELAEACADAPPFVTRAVGGCRESFEVHELSPALSAGPLYALGNGACALSGTSYPAARSLVAAGLAGAENFVELKREVAPTVGALSVLVETGADGARAATRLADEATGFVCDASFGSSSSTCRPTRRAFRTGLFTDDACTQPVSYAYASTPAACGEVDVIESDGYYLPGAEVTGDVWTKLTGTCQSRAQHPFLQNLLVIGEKLGEELGSFESRRIGDERLAVPLLFEGDVALIPATTPYFDITRQRDCEPKRLGEELRCLPAGFDLREINPELVRYADPLCLQPLIYCATGNCANEVYYDASERDACTAAPTYAGMRRPLTQVMGEVYQKDGDGDCTGPIEPSPVWTTEELQASDFGLVERATLGVSGQTAP